MRKPLEIASIAFGYLPGYEMHQPSRARVCARVRMRATKYLIFITHAWDKCKSRLRILAGKGAPIAPLIAINSIVSG